MKEKKENNTKHNVKMEQINHFLSFSLVSDYNLAIKFPEAAAAGERDRVWIASASTAGLALPGAIFLN